MTNKLKNRGPASPKMTSRGGFTLIETLIAVLLLATAIAGPLTIASKGLSATLVAKNQFTGFYLAQDAIEQVRFLRDSACLSSAGDADGCLGSVWLSALGACMGADGCILDSLASNPAAATACVGTCSVMKYDSTNKVFNYNPDSAVPLTPQRFIRTIKITNTTPDEAVVTVTVAWSDIAGITRVPITVRENLLRWHP